ncbi:inorganic phosphate transporter, PiT family [Sphingomonas sp. NFR04]|uniref:inorganic phosphate transporter n=1 Tax=Sphingomonas sp. NFR04 TaxID=1566283 RepID=UPI0008E47B0F|nr:inorganic phosphate transporter [Sphingomonas sp. NFR04]SFJ08322.1 inorganic phosphate transporter, PiT family [Sphingomonas sp. NFR04]
MDAGQLPFALLIALIAIALLFDMMNGLHDAANSIATIVSTNVLSPRAAVVWAAFFNFVAFLVFGLAVAKTMGTGIVSEKAIDVTVLFGALIGAIVWDAITWWWAMPSSSSHALVGGMVGAGLAKGGTAAIVWGGVLKTVVAIILSPLVGFALAVVLTAITTWVVRRFNPYKVDRGFRVLQFCSASLYSLGHGGNDAQKTMGIIAALLFTQGYLKGGFHVPLWVVLACHAAMALGTMIGGWRIIRTMGMRITSLKPFQGFSAELGGALTIFAAIGFGTPISTTHTIAGAIAGVGTMKSSSAVRWPIAGEMVFAWVLTLPAAAGVAALVYWLTHLVTG